MTEDYYTKEYKRASRGEASKEYINRMFFLSQSKDIDKKISRIVNNILNRCKENTSHVSHSFFEALRLLFYEVFL